MTRAVRDVGPSPPIDAAYTWVDGSDPAVAAELARHPAPPDPSAAGPCQFRDSGELRYSLRSLARHAPWIRRTHLVANGQVPAWLAREHPGLHLVTHGQIFPAAAVLPTFNSTAIEALLHRIPGLAPWFLYFNDDVFLGQPLRPDDLDAGRRTGPARASVGAARCSGRGQRRQAPARLQPAPAGERHREMARLGDAGSRAVPHCDFAASNRLPAVYFHKLFTDAGGLIAYLGSLEESYRKAATHVDKILKGAKPADLPIEQPTRLELVINLRAARELKLTIPQSLRARAEQVIE